MKIIYSWGHNQKEKPFIKAEIKEWVDAGYDITSINHREELNIERAYSPEELNDLYAKKDENLFRLYEKIRNLSENHDVFMVNFENVYHPDFIKSLKKIYTVIISGDDPESSDFCSKPYVAAFDHSFAWGVNFDKNKKITEKFLEWGAKRADFWPHGARKDMYDTRLTEKEIYNEERNIDLAFIGNPSNKAERLLKIKKAFPEMKIYGQGWSWRAFIRSKIRINTFLAGFWWIKKIPPEKLVSLYQECKIGINIHMSYGPSNLRMYQLPANGVMQICDCPEGLGQVFEIGKEVVTYYSVEEAIELIKYYLEHDEERKKIAAAGFKRTMKDYKRLVTFINAIEKIKKGIIADDIKYFKDGTLIH